MSGPVPGGGHGHGGGFPGARWIRFAARWVPLRERATWRREWEGEAAYAWQRLTREGPPSWSARVRYELRVRSCVIDALWMGKERMTMSGFWNEMRFAARSLMRSKTFTWLSVLTLALGIGVNTAVFTLVDGVLLQPLPFDDPEELLAITHEGRGGQDQLPMSTGLYQLYRDQSTTLDEIAIYNDAQINVIIGDEPERTPIQVASPSFFSVLRTEAALGRTFTEVEGTPEGERVVILSHAYWRDRFGADPRILGRTIEVNTELVEIVGVMPEGFGFPDTAARLWIPLTVDPEQAPLAAFGVSSLARMRPGVDATAASAEVDRLVARMDEFFPGDGAVAFLGDVELKGIVTPLKTALVGDIEATLWVLLGTVGFVLLIACANVANLLLVRAESRQRELALRVAVGAGRARIVRWFMSESALLAGAGGILGVLVSLAAIRLTLGFVPSDLPRMGEIGLDLRVLAFTAVITLGCALFFGIFPLTRYDAGALAERLKEGMGRTSTSSRRGLDLRNGLVVLQMALALMLLIGSGLMYRSFQALRSVDPGFDPQGVLAARITLPAAEVQSPAEVEVFFRQLRERLEAQPGVQSVGTVNFLPLVPGGGYYDVELEDHPRAEDEIPVFARHNWAGPGAIDALGLRLLEGRGLTDSDGAGQNQSLLVSRHFAELYWPDRSPLGRRVRLGGGDGGWYTIVGVVDDTPLESLEGEPPEMIYWPAVRGTAEAPQPARSMEVAIRTAGDPLAMVSVLRREVRALNPRIPVANPRPLQEVWEGATARTSFTMTVLGSASGIALLLGLIGIYGVISYVVSQRTREIGLRIALGATGASVRGLVVRQGLALAGVGIALGIVGSLLLRSVMASLLYGVSATDPGTYLVLSAVLTATAAGASFIPAFRASRVDPAGALRAD